jgi:hypothetical protein
LRAFLSENAKPHLAEGFVKAHPNQGHVLLGGAHGLVMALLPDIEPQEILRVPLPPCHYAHLRMDHQD